MGKFFDTLLNIGCALDWISPLVGLAQSAIYKGPVAHVTINNPNRLGLGEKDVKRLLSRNSVKSWGYLYNFENTELMFAFDERELEWAGKVLVDAGLMAGPFEERRGQFRMLKRGMKAIAALRGRR